jgi:hypothetical protein
LFSKTSKQCLITFAAGQGKEPSNVIRREAMIANHVVGGSTKNNWFALLTWPYADGSDLLDEHCTAGAPDAQHAGDVRTAVSMGSVTGTPGTWLHT